MYHLIFGIQIAQLRNIRLFTMASKRDSLRSILSFPTLAVSTFLLLNMNALTGQHIYEGPYRIASGIEGVANFQFQRAQNDTILNGEFAFSSTSKSNENDELLIGLEFSGQYNRGKKHDKWKFRHKQFESKKEPVIIGYDIVKPGTGKDYHITGEFQNGLANGQWKVLYQSIAGGNVLDTLLSTRAQFREGHFTGNVSGIAHGASLQGGFNSEGMLHGDWEIRHVLDDGMLLSEHRVYSHGIFIRHYFIFLGQQFEVYHVGLDSEENDGEVWKDVPLTSTYFDVILKSMSQVKSDDDIAVPNELTGEKGKDFISKTNTLISEILFSYSTYNQTKIWDELAGSQPISAGMMRMRVMPYSDEELKQLNKAIELYEDAQKIIQAFFKDPQVDISRHAYKEINFFSEVLHRYNSSSKELGGLARLLADSAFLYVDREVIFETLAPDIEYPDSVTYTFKDETHVEFFDFPEIAKINGYASYLHDHLSVIHMDLIQIEEQISSTLEQYKKQSQLSEKEEYLVQKRDSIIELYSGKLKSDKHNQFHQSIAPRIIDLTNEYFKSYAELTLENKVSGIDNRLNCYDKIFELYTVLERLPLRLDHLNELYTRTIWNPYTLTNMDERIKERVYKAYELEILPYILNDLYTNISCENIHQKAKNIPTLYKRMQEIREIDTRSEDRELRRSKSIEQTLEILQIEVSIN